jgi:hypothetical protein
MGLRRPQSFFEDTFRYMDTCVLGHTRLAFALTPRDKAVSVAFEHKYFTVEHRGIRSLGASGL